MLLTSKTTIPDSLQGTIDRPRLYRQLDGWRAYRGVLIQAPAGYGKSTLVSRWIETAGLDERAAWLSLAEEDSEPRRFAQYLAAALDRCLPGVAQTIEPVLKDPRSDARRVLERLLGILQQEFLTGGAVAEEHVLLIFDDLQRVRSADIDRFILQVLEFGPQKLHLVLVTRQQTDLPVARLYAQGKVLALDKEDLRFTEEEVAAYLQEHGFASFMGEDVARLTERSEGWVAALQLALLSLEQRGSVAALQRALQGNEQWLAHYLVDEVLARQRAEVQRFLLETSLLERFNADLCSAVTEMEDAAAQLAAITRADLFLIPLDREGNWYRYHHLFQELLQKRVKEELGAGAVGALQQRAGRWLADHGDYEAALRHLLAGGAVDAAVDMLETVMRRLIVRDHFAALRLFHLLPEPLCRELPQLALDRAFLAVVLDEPQLAIYVDQAKEALATYSRLHREHADWQGEWLVLHSGVLLKQGQLQAAAEGISQASAYVAVLDDLAAGLM